MAIFASQLLTVLVLLLAIMGSAQATKREIMYLTGQHPVVPDRLRLGPLTHVVLAFMNSAKFNEESPDGSWPIFVSIQDARRMFPSGTKVMVAIGGWGDTLGFSVAARTEKSRTRFAQNVAAMVDATGADGVDIDWEYPGGNGEDYKQIPNSEKAWEIDAYPRLLASIRHALGPSKLLSAAVPGMLRDMLAFTPDTEPAIMESVDWLNVMTYDLMNRRDNVTQHHTGVQLSLDTIDAHLTAGAQSEKLNLGFAFYAKYFRIAEQHHDVCVKNPIGCPTGLMEDPESGADLGKTGGFSYRDLHQNAIPDDVRASFARALKEGQYDAEGGGYYYFDAEEDLWWTFDTPEAIAKKLPLIVEERKLGGVFAWGLGEDAPEWKHLQALNDGLAQLGSSKDEL